MKLKDFLWLTKDVNPEAEIVIQIWGGCEDEIRNLDGTIVNTIGVHGRHQYPDPSDPAVIRLIPGDTKRHL